MNNCNMRDFRRRFYISYCVTLIKRCVDDSVRWLTLASPESGKASSFLLVAQREGRYFNEFYDLSD